MALQQVKSAETTTTFMQRNTSFFWASDALREFGDDVENDDAAGSSVGLTLDNDDDDEENIDSHQLGIGQSKEGIPDEEQALVGNTGADDRYGSTHDVPERRTLFKKKRFGAVSFAEDTKQGAGTVATKTIRFQIVIWHISDVDVQHGNVKMRFRITLFWNDEDTTNTISNNQNGRSTSNTDIPRRHSVWVMEGRQRACRKDLNNDQVKEMIDVPPVSILNATKFETVGIPEIIMASEHNRLMRWTCMYNATLFQGDHFRVDQFPHDRHTLKIKIGILADRGKGGRWDHHIYRLDLATSSDSQGSTSVPHGLIVDHVRAPDFTFDPVDLGFEFVPLMYGLGASAREKDRYLQVTLPVVRESGHFDKSIIPILVVLNIIAISCLPRNFDSATASTETMLSIAFVQVGIRLTVDSRLPSVGYTIKMQRVLNHCFWLLSLLVLESNTIFFLVMKRGWDRDFTDEIDAYAAVVAFMYNLYIMIIYYSGRPGTKDKLK